MGNKRTGTYKKTSYKRRELRDGLATNKKNVMTERDSSFMSCDCW